LHQAANRFSNATSALLVAMVAGATFWIAFHGGFYGVQPRAALAIAIWWVIGLIVSTRLVDLQRVPRLAVLTFAGLAGFAVWTAISLAWATDDETAFLEFDRVLLYLGIVVFAALLSVRSKLPRWADGFAIAITAIVVLALLSRLFPGWRLGTSLDRYLPGTGTRLSYPLNYWNGLAVLTALGIPFLLRVAVTAKAALIRGAAVAPIPAFAAVIYLASSRGGAVAAAVAMVAFTMIVDARWRVAGAVLCGVAGSLLVIHALRVRPILSDGPFTTHEAAMAGRRVAIIVLLVCVVTGLLFAAGSRLTRDIVVPRWLNRSVLAIVILATAVALIASHPVRRFHAFKTPASVAAINDPSQGSASGHIFSESGSGRWQLWKAAVSEWRHYPVTGHGAGSFTAWWLQRNTLTRFVRSAHSIYLQTLGELGLIGLALLVLALGPGVVATVVRRRTVSPATVGAFGASFIAFAIASGYDWMWEVTAVSVVGLASLGILVGGGAATNPPPTQAPRRSGSRLALRAVPIVVVLGVLLAEAAPALVDMRIQSSQAAVGRGDNSTAYKDALAAHAIQPWASSPYVQLALVDEQRGQLRAARAWIEGALARDPSSWTSWLVAARIDTKLGDISEARRSLNRARDLNPRSTVFQSPG
jgi:hypothetical protein